MDPMLYARIDAMEQDMIKTLQAWIRIPSVKAPAEPGAPFGAQMRHALNRALDDGRAMGFLVRDFDGYAGDIQMGAGEETLGILCHVDVVPAGDGWHTDPFGAQIDGDRMYGRGTSDDKGPCVAALYAMKAIKDAGIRLTKNVRLIVGCDEESGWDCMAHYASKTDMPSIGFSPDASFPVINTEKGLMQLVFRAPAGVPGVQVTSFNAGERRNVVPGFAEAALEGTPEQADRINVFAREAGLDVSARAENGAVYIRSTGVSGHAAFPEAAKNAIGQILLCLGGLGVAGALGALASKVGMETDGKSLGCDITDGLSGPLTLNLGVIRADKNAVSGAFDIRFPVMADPEQIVEAIRLALPGFEITVDTQKAPHHVPESSALVQALLEAYHEETGLPKQALAIGGGTYARCLKQGVAFGSAFPDDQELAHQANEYLSIKGLMANVRIFANAIVRLAGEGSRT
jgi:succinyl-diaminopimelate desuccinylase